MNYFHKVNRNGRISFAVNNTGRFLCVASKVLEGTQVAFWLAASSKLQLFTNKQDHTIVFYHSHKKRKDSVK